MEVKKYTRREYRQSAVAIVYMYLMTEKDIDIIIEENKLASSESDFISFLPLDEEMRDACYRVVDRLSIYKSVIDAKIKKSWRFERLGRLEQSILLIALAELEQGFQEKAIIVNEAVNLAKEFADENSYKFINGVLDSL